MSPRDAIGAAIEAARPIVPEPPRPLARDLPPAMAFPVDALGPLAASAGAIHDVTQAPLAMCAASILAAGALAAQAHADVVLPTGQAKPLSLYLLSIAASGERKTTVDGHALRPVRMREEALRERYAAELTEHENARAAWEEARKRVLADKKRTNPADIRAGLDALGPAPAPPLPPYLTVSDPTIEGLAKLLTGGHPSVGIFTAEGGMFIGGHAMADDARLRSAAGLNALWDGAPLRRARAIDGTAELPGRRVSLHLMAQPDVAAGFMSHPVLADTGLLGRMLVVAPETTAGSRMWREPDPASDPTIRAYVARILALLERPAPVADGTRNVLAPRALPLSAAARRLWIAFADHAEGQLGPGGELESIRPLGNKAAEHAARIAAVLALVSDPAAGEVDGGHMESGIRLAGHFLAEALRLAAVGTVHPDIRLAQRTLDWLRSSWPHAAVSTPDLYQRGPSCIRDKTTAHRAASILEDHGYLVTLPDGATIDGTRRREAWGVVR
jgi:hypothetical protein